MVTHQVCPETPNALRALELTGIIALVEDPSIQRFLGDILTRRGYRVMRLDATKAIELLKAGTPRVDLVITNTPLPFLRCADQVPLLYVAAAPDPDLAPQFSRCRVLTKPFRTDHLLGIVGELTAAL